MNSLIIKQSGTKRLVLVTKTGKPVVYKAPLRTITAYDADNLPTDALNGSYAILGNASEVIEVASVNDLPNDKPEGTIAIIEGGSN